jgi:hypothetical protein
MYVVYPPVYRNEQMHQYQPVHSNEAAIHQYQSGYNNQSLRYDFLQRNEMTDSLQTTAADPPQNQEAPPKKKRDFRKCLCGKCCLYSLPCGLFWMECKYKKTLWNSIPLISLANITFGDALSPFWICLYNQNEDYKNDCCGCLEACFCTACSLAVIDGEINDKRPRPGNSGV